MRAAESEQTLGATAEQPDAAPSVSTRLENLPDCASSNRPAYVKARYSKHYAIGEDELIWLGQRLELLGQVVHAISVERIDMLSQSAG